MKLILHNARELPVFTASTLSLGSKRVMHSLHTVWKRLNTSQPICVCKSSTSLSFSTLAVSKQRFERRKMAWNIFIMHEKQFAVTCYSFLNYTYAREGLEVSRRSETSSKNPRLCHYVSCLSYVANRDNLRLNFLDNFGELNLTKLLVVQNFELLRFLTDEKLINFLKKNLMFQTENSC